MIAILFVTLIILTSANLARAAISGFWADYGQAIVAKCHVAGQKYPAKQLVRAFLTQGLDRYLLLCAIAYAAVCFMALSWVGVL